MNVYLDLTTPLFVVKEPSFDAVPIQMNSRYVEFLDAVAAMIKEVKAAEISGGAPEDNAQQRADLITKHIEGILNVKTSNTIDAGSNVASEGR
jgi:hypothetical protein